MTILFGALLYLYLWQLDANVLLRTPWGQTLFAALLLALGTLAFGMIVVVSSAKRIGVHLAEDRWDHMADMERLQRALNQGQGVVLVLGLIIIGLMVAA